MMRMIVVSFIIICYIQECRGQKTGTGGFRFMFWNVENLFDTEDDPLTADNDFLPGGAMRWSQKRYRKKINDVYKTIIAAGEWEPPDIVAFCEVENRWVLEDLISDTYLSRYDYDIIHEDSPDERGIDVCLIYRKDRLNITGYRYLMPDGVTRKNFGSRTVLYAGFDTGEDTVHLFFNHWPSRRGGALAGQEMRLKIASMVRSKADSLLALYGGKAKIIIAGDFNCRPDDREISVITAKNRQPDLVNITRRLSDKGLGTYRYMGTWEMIDQVIVSDYLLMCRKGVYAGKESAVIFSPDFMLTTAPNYPGTTPFSMYRGYRYQGGISDHLPVLLDLFRRREPE